MPINTKSQFINDYIRANYMDKTHEQIMEDLGITKNQLAGRAFRMGLKKLEGNRVSTVPKDGVEIKTGFVRIVGNRTIHTSY